MTDQFLNYDWRSEIDRNLALLSPLKTLSFEVFKSQPQYYGAAARYLQLLAKYTIELSPQSPQIVVTEELKQLWRFHRPETLKQLGVKDIYQTTLSAERVINGFVGQFS